MCGQDVAARIDSRAVRQPEIHEHHVGTVKRRSFHGVRNAACFGNDLDGFRLPEKRPQAQPDDFMIVDEHQPNPLLHRILAYPALPNCTTIRVPLIRH